MKALLNDYGKTIVFSATLLIVLAATCIAQKGITFVGEVIAYRLGDFPEMAGDGSRVLVVSVKQPSKRKEISQFIIIHAPKTLDFPVELYDDEKVGKFTLIRKRQCDMSIEEFDRRAFETNEKFVIEARNKAKRENPNAVDWRVVVPLPAFMVSLPKAKAEKLSWKDTLRCYEARNVSIQ